MKQFLLILSIALLATSCNARKFYDEVYADDDAQTLQLGAVQKNIFPGMSQGDVACALGSPNIVTKDKEGKETWIYDKIATEVRKSGTSGLILFCQTGADYVGRAQVSQKTLTVIIKFGPDSSVESVSYHSSKF